MPENSPPEWLCLDLGTRTGWAGGTIEHEDFGLWDLTLWGGDLAAKCDVFSRELSRRLDDNPVDVIAVEEPFAGGRDMAAAAKLLNGLFAFALVIGRRRSIPVRILNPSEIKIATCGWTWRKVDGKRLDLPKDAIVAAVNARRQGRDVRDHNTADALAMLDLLRAEQRGSGAPRIRLHRARIKPRKPIAQRALFLGSIDHR